MKLITNSTYLTFISFLILSVGCLRNPEDCEGTQDGSAYIDKCGGCVGGITNLEACVDEDVDGFDDRDMAFLQDLRAIMLNAINMDLFNIGEEVWRGGRLIYFEGILNALSGEIPESISDLTHIEHLNISGSYQLTGEIPSEIGNLINLRLLALDGNRHTGQIPESIGELVNLTELYLYDNQLSGTIPTEICNLTNLTLELYNNQLCPPYPECLTEEMIGKQDTSNCP